MSDQYDTQELNGYKFSFNRTNPYINQLILETQSDTNLPHINTQPQFLNHTNQNVIQQDIKILTLKPLKQPSIVNKNSSNSTNTTNKNISNINKNSLNINKNTKSMFYNKFQQNQKNKMLMDLYLRKTKPNKIQLQPAKYYDKLLITQKNNDKSLIKQKLNLLNSKHSDQQHLIIQTYLTDRNHYKFKHHNKIHHRHSSTTNHVMYNEVEDQQTRQKQNKKRKDSVKRGTKKSNHQSKLLRNLSQFKFNAYLSSPKQYVKIKPISLSTAPVQKASKFTTTPESFSNNDDVNKLNKLKIMSQHKTKNKKYVNLKIHTQGSLDQYALCQENSLIALQSVKNNMQTVRNKIGALKYKSPKMILSSRNQRFISKKQTPKIKLFTQQEQNNIIKEFYTQEINQ